MIVDDYMNVLGRGWVIIARGEELKSMAIHCEDKIVKGDLTFIVKGVERTRHNEWWNDRVGLILAPNNKVPDYFEVDDEIEIVKV